MPRVTGLRSPHARVGRIVVFGRMLDKLRLSARGMLPPDYRDNLGEARPLLFDARCCRFLGVPYPALRDRALQGGCDEEILAWAHARGTPRSDEDCMIWNRFMTKFGWRDDRSDVLRERIKEYGLEPARPETQFELLDIDEGRPLGGTRSWEAQPISFVIVMGVSGCGKTTVGRGLAGALGWEFREADDFHPAANIAKMSAGVPLGDADRAPWLAAVRADIEASAARGAKAVVACSALKQAYRDVLAPDPANTRFVHLRGDFALIRGRLAERSGHYMGESLLQSQFEALEPPVDALSLDAADAAAVSIKKMCEVLLLP
jgi:carbohydrate kinase (thermoresistant glucokinase family)